ncbi:hypothetical protein RI129_011052 [Pyrocoelia pectoralis]|uniref:Uncharacterized protein n=1 Tax=Pyrocoelia pectoralis TaxID=417401 RepID=A0AAN7V7C4_9COLE
MVYSFRFLKYILIKAANYINNQHLIKCTTPKNKKNAPPPPVFHYDHSDSHLIIHVPHHVKTVHHVRKVFIPIVKKVYVKEKPAKDWESADWSSKDWSSSASAETWKPPTKSDWHSKKNWTKPSWSKKGWSKWSKWSK